MSRFASRDVVHAIKVKYPGLEDARETRSKRESWRHFKRASAFAFVSRQRLRRLRFQVFSAYCFSDASGSQRFNGLQFSAQPAMMSAAQQVSIMLSKSKPST